MILKSKTSYFIGFDFVVEMKGRKDSKLMQKYIDKNTNLRWMEDLRLPCVSVVTHDNEMKHIFNYTLHYGRLMEKNSAIINYLDFGYIPIAFYPTCYAESNILIDRKIEEFGLNAHKFPAIYAGDVRFRTAHTDSWVSRLEVSKKIGISPESIKTQDIIRMVFQNEIA
jgi:hypothetical protein